MWSTICSIQNLVKIKLSSTFDPGLEKRTKEQGKKKRGCTSRTPPDPMRGGFDFDRVKGMMLGFAIGDSLGRQTEGLSPQNRGVESE
jgi:hypothetical protein